MTEPFGRSLALTTERLRVGEWRTAVADHPADLVRTVTTVLTAATTEASPPPWRGDYDDERARAWIAERDAESPTLLVSERGSDDPVGLVILFDEPLGDDGLVEVRLGYVLAESAWGRGLATELVGALVDAARRDPKVAVLSGGVATGNVASARVLERHGFTATDTSADETVFALDVSAAG